MSKEQREELELELEQAEAIMKDKHHNSAEHKEAKSNAETLRKLIDELPKDVANANDEAGRIISEASEKASEIIAEAVEKAKSIEDEAVTRATNVIKDANEEAKNIRELHPHVAGSADDDDEDDEPEVNQQASLGDCMKMERKQRQKAIDEKAEAEKEDKSE